MKSQFFRSGSILLFIIIGFSSCATLKTVNNFSSASLDGIKKFEDINYGFRQHCIDRCQFEAIRNFQINKETECDCDIYKKADKTTMLIYKSIKEYFNGLANLSNNKLTNYKFEELENALTEDDFGNIKVGEKEVEAFSVISGILLKATTDLYRRKNIKQYVGEANGPILVLLEKFQFILQQNLVNELNGKKTRIYAYYQEMKMDPALNGYEKDRAATDYYQKLSEINLKQKQIDAFARSLKSISEGHQKLYDNREKMSARELAGMLAGYAINIQDIISEFNKLNK